MSADHVPGHRGSAREKAEAARRAQASAERRKRQVLILGAVVALLAVAVVVGAVVSHTKATTEAALGTGPFAAPSGAAGSDGLAIPFGAHQNAKVTLVIYEDFRCPFCKSAESMFEPVYKAYAADGRIKVQYHLVNLIDRNLGGTGSIRSGNAGACAQSAGRFPELHDVFYAKQPEETDDAYGTNATLIALARRVPGLVTAPFEACVNGDTHGSWVVKNFNALNDLLKGAPATPYYAIDGTQFPLTSQSPAAQRAAFKAALDRAVARS